jgi:signal recognition particle subunit SEC65
LKPPPQYLSSLLQVRLFRSVPKRLIIFELSSLSAINDIMYDVP